MDDMELIENYRREKPSMSTLPLSRSEKIQIEIDPDTILDYATAGTKISGGMQHLDESLPVGQKLRSELAFVMLRKGVQELELWMRARGYEV